MSLVRHISVKSEVRTYYVEAKDAVFISSGIWFPVGGRVGKKGIMGEETLNSSSMSLFIHLINVY